MTESLFLLSPAWPAAAIADGDAALVLLLAIASAIFVSCCTKVSSFFFSSLLNFESY